MLIKLPYLSNTNMWSVKFCREQRNKDWECIESDRVTKKQQK